MDCKGSVYVKNISTASLTNGIFRWGNVSITFSCNGCSKLTSLEGAPEEVGKDFNCSYCTSLTSLEGCPKRVFGNFTCIYCKNLKSFKGAPKKISYSFDCTACNNITSLEGAPEKVMKLICNNYHHHRGGIPSVISMISFQSSILYFSRSESVILRFLL